VHTNRAWVGGAAEKTGATASCRLWSYPTGQTAKQVRIQQSLEPRYNRTGIYHLTVAGQNQCKDLEDELLSFPRALNDDASDSAPYRVEIAQPPSGLQQSRDVAQTRRKLTENQAR
jgi:hypothetical protein